MSIQDFKNLLGNKYILERIQISEQILEGFKLLRILL